MTVKQIIKRYPVGTVLHIWGLISGLPVNFGMFTVGKKTLYKCHSEQTWEEYKKEVERIYCRRVQRIIIKILDQ
jgi:hypothetical protein